VSRREQGGPPLRVSWCAIGAGATIAPRGVRTHAERPTQNDALESRPTLDYPWGLTISRFFATALLIRPGEGRRTSLLFLHLLLASSVFILGRTVRDTLFLTFYPVPLSKALPWMFILYGVASALTVVVYGRFADRVARHRLIGISIAIGVVTYLATWTVARSGQATWIYPVFYVWSEVAANLFIVQFWTLANDLHDARAAKRLFGTIGSARILGVVLVGLVAGSIVKAIGTAQLLLVLAGMMACIAGLALLLAKEPRVEGAGARTRRHGPPPGIRGDPYVRLLALMILLAFTALTIGDYQFKAIARASYRGDDLARFFSFFYAATGTIAFVFQILVTPRLLARLGVGVGMSVMPAVFGGASALLFFFPKLGVVTPMKFADNGFQYTIHDTTLQALYVPFAPAVKARTRAFLDAAVKPLSYGAGGVVLLVLAPILSVGQLAAVTVPLVLAWFVVIGFVRRGYQRALESTLSVRGTLAFDNEYVLDAAGRRALIETLERGDARQALVALEQLGDETSRGFITVVEGLAVRGEVALRAAALGRLATLPGASVEPALGALGDGDPDVRAAGARACAALAGDEAIDALAPLLADRDRDVRVAAAAGLLADGWRRPACSAASAAAPSGPCAGCSRTRSRRCGARLSRPRRAAPTHGWCPCSFSCSPIRAAAVRRATRSRRSEGRLLPRSAICSRTTPRREVSGCCCRGCCGAFRSLPPTSACAP
jgi:ATP/ADP translocase